MSVDVAEGGPGCAVPVHIGESPSYMVLVELIISEMLGGGSSRPPRVDK